MTGRWVLAGRVSGFTRDGLGRVHFGGLVATRSRPVESDGSGTRRVGELNLFSKIPKISKIVITVQ
jgi:hypothetical protein